MERESNLYLMREVIRAHHEYIMSVAISMQSVIQKERAFNSYRVSIKVSIRGWSKRSIRTKSILLDVVRTRPPMLFIRALVDVDVARRNALRAMLPCCREAVTRGAPS